MFKKRRSWRAAAGDARREANMFTDETEGETALFSVQCMQCQHPN